MRNIFILLSIMWPFIGYSQTNEKTNFHFYYGTTESLGAEILINGRYGVGFSGTNAKQKGLGEFSPGEINEWDLNNKVSTVSQKFYTMYSVFSFGYIKNTPIQISYDLGVSWYQRDMNFLDPNRNEYYHKNDNMYIKPMIGINATYAFTKNVGWQVGIDTFSGVNTGFVVYF